MTRLCQRPRRLRRRDDRRLRRRHRRCVRRVPGGVVRSTVDPAARSRSSSAAARGHYPAFGGLVGPGLAHGAAMGNVFASPSAQQVHSVATAARARRRRAAAPTATTPATSCNFDAAQDRLQRRGHRLPHGRRHRRHLQRLRRRDGTSAAASPATSRSSRSPPAAAEAGYDLDEVVRVAAPRQRAHPLVRRRLRRLHPARRGGSRCSPCPRAGWPSASASTASPASTRPTSRPPTSWPSCSSSGCSPSCPNGIADRRGPAGRCHPQRPRLGQVRGAVRRLPPRRPAAARPRASRSSTRRSARLVTSFDMAGHSLTLFWLDDELEPLLDRPGRHPGLPQGHRRGRRNALGDRRIGR